MKKPSTRARTWLHLAPFVVQKGQVNYALYIRSCQGTAKRTEFYLAILEYGEIADLVTLPEDLYGDQLLDGDEEDEGAEGDDEMQRKLNWGRVRKEMVPYLMENDNSFYSSLTLFIVPRDLAPLKEDEGYKFKLVGDEDYGFGILELKSSVILFPGDGQHRAASIKEAVKKDYKLATVRIPVVLIPFTRKDQVRQLFSDLNLNAKPINKTIGLAFETRDPLAILSKRVAREVPLFRGRLNRRTNSLSATSRDVITMNALYASNELLVEAFHGDAKAAEQALRGLRSLHEDDKRVGEAAESLVAVWNIVTECFPIWDPVMNGKTTPGEVRDKFVFAHGIGWQAIAHAASAMIKAAPSKWELILEDALTNIDWSRDNPDWQSVAMVGNRMNNTSGGIKATAGYILKRSDVAASEYAQPYLNALNNSTLFSDEPERIVEAI